MFNNTINKLRHRSMAGVRHRADQRDYQYLLHASDRELSDIGITRMDVVSRKSKRFRFSWFEPE